MGDRKWGLGDGLSNPDPPFPIPPEAGGHIAALDGLRGLAILLVMIFHQTVMTPRTAFDRGFVHLTGQFACGVDLFFVLSGFLITGILVDARGADHYFRNFYARRSLRIVPLYYAVLAVTLLVLPQLPHPKLLKWAPTGGVNQVWYWLFLSNWSIGLRGHQHGILDVSWSLSIEEQFYILWPLVVWSLGRRNLLRVCVGIIVGAFACRGVWTAIGAPEMWSYRLTPARIDTLAVGAWIALAARGGGGLRVLGLVPWARWVAAGSGLIVAALYGPMVGSPVLDVLRPTVGVSAVAALFGASLVLAVGSGPHGLFGRLLRGRVLTTLGLYSYALYLFHYPIQATIRDTIYGPGRFPTLLGSPLPGQLLFYALATAPALACAWLSWHCYERPWLSLKRFFPSGRAAIATPRTLELVRTLTTEHTENTETHKN